MRAWPRAVGGGALAVLLALALGAAARAGRAWVWAGGDREPVEAGTVGPPPERPRPAAGARKILPLVAADRGRLLADLLDLRPGSRQGEPLASLAPAAQPGSGRLVSLPGGAGLPELLRAAGLPADLPVAGAPPRGTALASGLRLVVEPDGRARLDVMPAARRLRLGIPLDLNSAPAEDLARLPGIGPRLAARIVEDRAARGPFAGPDALLRVRGIGLVTLGRVRSLVATDAREVGGR